MADITKRTAKRLRGHLLEGEQVRVSVLVETKGTLGVAAGAMVVLPRTTMNALERRADAVHDETGGLAARFPGSSCAIVVTDRRILISRSNGITFTEPDLVLERGQLQIAENHGRGIGRRIVLRFADSSTVSVDASRGQPFDRLDAELRAGTLGT